MTLHVRRFAALSVLGAVAPAIAVPDFVAHDPSGQVFQEAAGITNREPETPREGDAVDVWFKTGPSFTYDSVAIYYTTDGSAPAGGRGIPQPGTSVLLNFGPNPQTFFVRNEPGQNGNDDWWRAQLPSFTRTYGTQVRYSIGVWQSNAGDPERFATDTSDGDSVFSFTNKLAWPGSGSGTANPSEGYPPLHFWKEEAVAGNNYMNVMLDQNGSLYDIYYPSAGAVAGVTTKNEGYNDGGQDQFPPFLAPDERGQMHLNQAFVGLRPTSADGSGTTYWLTNASGTDYQNVSQTWDGDTNVIRTTQSLNTAGVELSIVQLDAALRGVTFPTDLGGNPNRGVHVKRVQITNNGGSPVELNAYFFADWAINGGDSFDNAMTDTSRGAMIAFDNTQRFTSSSGEYNPTTFGDYEKNVSVYLAAAMKIGSGPATDFWSDTSSDTDLGWIGGKMTIQPNATRAFGIYIVGGFDDFAGATGTYDFQQAPVLDTLLNDVSLGTLINGTKASWGDWLAEGILFDCPDPMYNELFTRGLLGTALHLDGENGGIIAGMHNGAYPYVWPRDAAWAAITLARTGHIDDAKNIYNFLRDVAFRDVEGWGRKGFWKQKYSTDGQTIWSAPQVDETSCYPWGINYIYDVTGDVAFVEDHYDEVYEAAIASSQDSTIDNRLRYEENVKLVYSMNLWEDLFDVTVYSNASVVRGLRDAARIADTLDNLACPGGPGTCNYHNDEALFNQRADDIAQGLDDRLDWNGENTDISQLGITYPFDLYDANSPRATVLIDRINGTDEDFFGNLQPLVQYGPAAGQPLEWLGLVDRYWGDTYWNGGPWFLTTLWYGAYYAKRQDFTPGTADIDNHKSKIDLLIDKLGPMGFGAEQIASNATLKYPGQTDYSLQTAYPNAWESMSFLVDAIMLFLDYRPDAANNTLRIRPKLPSDWSFMDFDNILLGSNRIDVRVERASNGVEHVFTNVTGSSVDFDTVLRVDPSDGVCSVTVNGAPTSFTRDNALGTIQVTGALATGADAVTTVVVHTGFSADWDNDGDVDTVDLLAFLALWFQSDASVDIDGDAGTTVNDLLFFLSAWFSGCA